jgi:CDP-diacylglycerol--serine O-phosphatidyltransferase
LAILFMILSVFFDLIDGAVARKLNQTTKMWAQLDSLSDLVSFWVTPAIIGIVWFWHNEINYFLIIGAIIFVASGAWRLARFNVSQGKEEQISEYDWFPITINWLIFSILLFFNIYFNISWILILIIFLFMSFLMVSKIKIKKISF